jgi:hypothetical protein
VDGTFVKKLLTVLAAARAQNLLMLATSRLFLIEIAMFEHRLAKSPDSARTNSLLTLQHMGH